MSTTRGRRRALRKAGAVLGATALTMIVTAGTAWAHLEPIPGEVAKGEVADVTFRVPNERPDAGTTGVRLDLPTDRPVAIVKVRATAGWRAELVKTTLPKPVKTGNVTITEAITAITWTAQPGTRIGPGEFGDFAVTLGPMPTGIDTFVVNAVQTYDSGEVVNWNQPAPEDGAEPENPAPVLTLTAATGDSSGESEATAAPGSDNDDALWLGGAGLALGALAVGLAAGALIRTRRTPAPTTTKDITE